MFKHSKLFRMYNVPDANLEDFNETHERFTGWGSEFLQAKYGHVQFESSEHFIALTGFKWHDTVKALIKSTRIDLIDAETVEITAYYDTEGDWDRFNFLCDNQQISHGWHTFATGIYAVLNK